MATEDKERIVSASEVGNYVVCAEAWRLKYLKQTRYREGDSAATSKELRDEWFQTQEVSSQLRNYAKVAYLLLVAITILVFMLESAGTTQWLGEESPTAPNVAAADISVPETGEIEPYRKIKRILVQTQKAIPIEIIILFILLGMIIFIWDLFDRRMRTMRKKSGLTEETETVSMRGSSHLPSSTYRSSALGLTSKPDALVKEDGFLIPVDRKPMTSRVRDRHVVQMLVHLRLIEEAEKQRPPYGILLMGKKVRNVRIKNSDEKQRWLDTIIDEMRSIMDGVPAQPSPSPMKCKRCDVREVCEFSAHVGESTDDQSDDSEDLDDED